MAVAQDRLLAQGLQEEPSFAAWLVEAVLLALGVLVAITALSVFLMTVDVTARALLPVLAIAAGGLLSGALLLRRASQAHLHAQESGLRLRGMLDHAPDGIILLDAATARRPYVNATAARLFGMTVAELQAVPMEAINVAIQANGESALIYSRRLLRRALAGEDVRAGWRFRRAGGAEFPARIGLTRIPGKARLLRVSIVDLSVEATLEASRQSAEERIRTLVDHAPEGVLLVEQVTHVIRYANRAAAHLLRADAGRLAGQLVTRAAVNPQPGGDDPAMLLTTMVREVTEGSESVRRWRLRRIDGVEVNAEVRALLLPGVEGLFRVSMIDLTTQDELAAAAARAQSGLLASEARFRHLTAISADWYWETDADGRLALIDGGGEALRAQQRSLMGRYPWEIARFATLDVSWDEVRAAHAACQPYRQTLRYQRPGEAEGNGRVIEIAADPVLDANDQLQGYRGVARDVTERFFTQKRLRQSEAAATRLADESAAALQRLELIVSRMPAAFVVRDAENFITSWNPEATRIFGYTESEVLGKPPTELIVPPERHDSVRERHRARREGHELTTVVTDNITKTGVRILCEWRNARLADSTGKFVGSISMALDVSSRERAEMALKESEAHFKRLTELASDYKWATDAEHRITELVADAGGVARGDALGKQRWDIPHLRPLGGTWDAHRLTLDARQPFDDLTVEVLGTDGRRRFRRVRGEPVFDPHLGFTGYRGVGVDISYNHRQTLKRAGEARLFEALARGESIAALMEILCEVIEGVTERRSRAAVMQVVDGHLKPLAASHLPGSYTSAIDGIGIGALAGCCGAAAALNKVVVCTDIETDERWRTLRLMARNAGIRACWSTPVCSADGQVIGTLAVFMHEAADPGMGDLDATASAARIAALVIDRFRAQAALRESEERLRRLVSLSSDWEWEQDEHFMFTRVGEFQPRNDRPVAISIGRTRWDNPSLRPIDFTWKEHRAVLEAHQPFSHTLFEFTSPAHQRFYWAIRGEPVFDLQGRFAGYRGVGSDISVRYRHDAMRLGERALFEGMAQGATLPALSMILASTLCGVLERGGAVVIKERYHHGLQTVGSHGVRPGWSTLLEHTLALDADPTTCGEAARTGSVSVAADAAREPRYAGVRDQIIAVGIGATWSMPVTGNDGVVMATVGIAYPAPGEPPAQDIEFAATIGRLTEFVLNRFRSAETVRESAERYRRLVEQSQEGVLIHEWGIIEYANPAFLRMVGAPRMEDLVGMNAVKLYVKEAQVRSQERLARLREGDESVNFAEMTLQRLDGGELEVEVAANLFDSHGRRLIQSQFRDISARKFTEREILNLNQELEQRVTERTSELSSANRELEAFSYTVAHDLRAPLRAIDGFSQLLKADLGTTLTTGAQRDLDAISTSARRMSDLINGLLDFSRVGRSELNRRYVNMQTLAESTSAEVANERKVQVHIGALPEVLGDAVMLRQVWANLIGNAVKFSAKKNAPRVTIDCLVDAGEACFAVADNGDGIDMAYADKLFGVFQRLHSTEEFEGTGVGLAIVKRIVERHGGRVWVQSAPGAGARFFFTLPLQEGEAVQVPGGATGAAAAGATAMVKG